MATSAAGITVTGTVDVNGAYTLPTRDGSANPSIDNRWFRRCNICYNLAYSASGSNIHVQYNDGGVLGGEFSFTYNKATDKLTVKNLHITGVLSRVQDYGAITHNPQVQMKHLIMVQ